MLYGVNNPITSVFYEREGLARFFEKQFAKPRVLHSKRFVWDKWFIKDQYSLLRTPAAHYFPAKVYKKFEQELVEFGQNVLGCAELTPPWLSVYTEGDSQNWHADNPHGPWAYVFSLTPWKARGFSGGETMIMKDAVLNYWKPQNLLRGLELDDLIEKIPAEFNQLLVFDPRLPHAVDRVSGVQDPLQGRLVIHGWFTKPCPFVEGSLSKVEDFSWLDDALSAITQPLAGATPVVGCASFRVRIKSDGKVSEVKSLADSLHSLDANFSTRTLLHKISSSLKSTRFPKARGGSQMTIPFIFE